MEHTEKQGLVFEAEQLKAIAGIGGHLAFFKELYGRYEWESTVAEQIAAMIRSIEEKQQDRNLNMSIIGEFSNGKSTLINALLRTNLLQSGCLPGTTTVSTLIRYSSQYNVAAEYKNAQAPQPEAKLSFWGSSIHWVKGLWRKKEKPLSTTLDEVRNQLVQLTTDNELGKSIKRVILEAPLQVLQNGLVIVDTPGTESMEGWHDDVTRDAIQNFSDASIILTTAISPCPDTLIRFIRSNLTNVLSGCVFLVSKIDLLRPSERDAVLHYVSERLKNEFHLQTPLILPFTPLLVLAEADESLKAELDYHGKDYNELLQQSYQSEKEIYSFLSQRRTLIQIQKLLTLSSCLYDEMDRYLDELKAAYEERHRHLAEAPTKELKGFIQEQMAAHIEILSKECTEAKAKFNALCNKCESQTIQEAKDTLMPLKNFRLIKHYIKKVLSAELLTQAGYLNDSQETYSRTIETRFQEQLNEFSSHLFGAYPFLQRIRAETYQDKRRKLTFDDRRKERIRSFNKAWSAFRNKLCGMLFWGGLFGAMAGGLAGIFLPEAILLSIPIGCISGIASVSAVYFRPKFQAFKESYCMQLEEHFSNLFADWSFIVKQRMEESETFWGTKFEAQAQIYKLQYLKAVESTIETERQDKEKLVKNINQLTSDKLELTNRRELISDTQNKIQSFADGV